MSSPSEPFECRWRASRGLLKAYLAAQALAWLALWSLDIAAWLAFAGLSACLGHAAWVIPRSILFSHRDAFRGLRQGREGWQIWRERSGWQPIQIAADSLALPWLVVLRFRVSDGWLTRSICLPRDALTPEVHRRLRVLLRFARRG